MTRSQNRDDLTTPLRGSPRVVKMATVIEDFEQKAEIYVRRIAELKDRLISLRFHEPCNPAEVREACIEIVNMERKLHTLRLANLSELEQQLDLRHIGCSGILSGTEASAAAVSLSPRPAIPEEPKTTTRFLLDKWQGFVDAFRKHQRPSRSVVDEAFMLYAIGYRLPSSCCGSVSLWHNSECRLPSV